MDKEQEILQNMKLLNISREESEQLWEDDHSDELTEEQAELEQKAKVMGRRYERNISKERKKPVRERVIDLNKQKLLAELQVLLENLGGEITEVKTETEIKFTYKEDTYTFKLIKARKKKETK